jgi:hypothetical protein
MKTETGKQAPASQLNWFVGGGSIMPEPMVTSDDLSENIAISKPAPCGFMWLF